MSPMLASSCAMQELFRSHRHAGFTRTEALLLIAFTVRNWKEDIDNG